MLKIKKIIIANWKMNPESFFEAKKIFLGVKKDLNKLKKIQTIICPPSIYLDELVKLDKRGQIIVGAQDVFEENKGSFTGAISPNMLKKNKIDYVIIGHSERRSLGENNELVNKKVKLALKSGLKVILCIGEKERDKDAQYFEFLKEEIAGSLKGVSIKNLKNILIAYEPIWAISNNSKGKAMTSGQIYEMVIFIKKILFDYFKIKTNTPPILYGGSVNPKNTKEILEEGNVDGLLIGRASLDIKKFKQILDIANS